MKAVNVVVEVVNTKNVTTRFGVKETYSFKANDGQWYSTAFKKPPFDSGDVVSFDYTPDKFGNQVDMSSIVKGAAPVTAVATASGAMRPVATPTGGSGGNKGSFPIGPLDGQRSIVRQNALTNARELFVGTLATNGGEKRTLDACAKLIIGLAKVFESYTTGDADLAEVKTEMASEQKRAA